MNNIKFSIIVPIYNIPIHKGENLFTRCVESLLKQAYNNIEVILVDDGSKDNAPQLCEEYARRDSRIVVIHKANGGLSSARNMGVRIATGEYIIFVDADDEIDPSACEVFANIVKQHPDIEIISSNIKAVNNGKIRYICFTETDVVTSGSDFIKRQMRNGTFYSMAQSHITARKYLLNNNLLFAEHIFINEDNEWTARLFLTAQRVTTSNFIHYIYNVLDVSLGSPNANKEKFIETILYCYDLESRFALIEDKELRQWLMNYLLKVWFNAFRKGELYKKRYEHIIRKDFVKGKPRLFIDRVRCFLFRISPYLYWHFANIAEKLRWGFKK